MFFSYQMQKGQIDSQEGTGTEERGLLQQAAGATASSIRGDYNSIECAVDECADATMTTPEEGDDLDLHPKNANRRLRLGMVFALVAVLGFSTGTVTAGPLMKLSKDTEPTTKKTFAFDKTFPEDGSAWEFLVPLDDNSTALAEVENKLVAKMVMDPIYRCDGYLYGVQWQEAKWPILRRMYSLKLEDADPPSEDVIIVRHQVLWHKMSKETRFDKFWCVGEKNEDGVCPLWDSEGYVRPKSALKITKGATDNPIYKQEFKLVPKSNEDPKICPPIKSSFWCLWIFCPVVKED